MVASVHDPDRYTKYGSESAKNLAQLNTDTWFLCKSILSNPKSYEKEVPQREIKAFLDLLQYTYEESDLRKIDILHSMIKADIPVTPLIYLQYSKKDNITELIEPPMKYYKENGHLWNKEPPL